MTDDQIERLIQTLTDLTGCFKSIAATAEIFLQKSFPARAPVKEAKITYVPSEQEKIVENLQGDEADRTAPIERWTTLGPREAEFERREQEAETGAGGSEGSNGSRR